MPTDQIPARGYTGIAVGLHRLIVVLLAAQFAIAWTMPEIHQGTIPERLSNWHLSTGVLILIVMLVRLVWRSTHRAPAAPADLTPALKLLSRGTHYILYGLLIVLPLLGWANASARDWPVTVFGTIRLPHLVGAGSALGRSAGDSHATRPTLWERIDEGDAP